MFYFFTCDAHMRNIQHASNKVTRRGFVNSAVNVRHCYRYPWRTYYVIIKYRALIIQPGFAMLEHYNDGWVRGGGALRCVQQDIQHMRFSELFNTHGSAYGVCVCTPAARLLDSCCWLLILLKRGEAAAAKSSRVWAIYSYIAYSETRTSGSHEPLDYVQQYQ